MQRRADGANGTRLCVGVNESLIELFGPDPCPGSRKALFLTVEISGREFPNQYAEEHDLLVEPVRIVADEWHGSLDVSDSALNIRILAATIGEMGSPASAVDITKLVQRRADDGGGKVLIYDRTENLGYVLPDPAPGSDKVMIIRYVMWNRIGELRVELFPTEEGFKLKKAVYLEVASQRPRFILHAATFGHPSLPTLRYDCTERIQGRMDEFGSGEYFSFLADADFCEWLGGDPYPYVRHRLLFSASPSLAAHLLLRWHPVQRHHPSLCKTAGDSPPH